MVLYHESKPDSLPDVEDWLKWRAALVPSTKLAANLIVTNGFIFTSDPSLPFADSMVIRDCRILRVGNYSSPQVLLLNDDLAMSIHVILVFRCCSSTVGID
ncbi:hypothetical protein SLE2022_065970 [Rubroshorea leprosula]